MCVDSMTIVAQSWTITVLQKWSKIKPLYKTEPRQTSTKNQPEKRTTLMHAYKNAQFPSFTFTSNLGRYKVHTFLIILHSQIESYILISREHFRNTFYINI